MFPSRVTPDKKSADITYYNMRYMNPAVTGNSFGPGAKLPFNCVVVFDETRASTLLDKPEDYYLFIARFTADTSTLPMLIPQLQNEFLFPIPPGNISDTVYSISLSWGAFSNVQTVLYIPQDKTITIPDVASDVNLYTTSPYFWIYDYQHFVDMVNDAFYRSFQQLVTDSGNTQPSAYAPFMKYNRDLGVFDIVVDGNGYQNIYWDGSFNTSAITIHFNTYLYNVFFNINSDHVGDFEGNGHDYMLRMENTGVNVHDNTVDPIYYDPYDKLAINPINSTAVFVMQCEWNINGSICEDMQLLFTTSQIPVNSELLSPVIPYSNQPLSSIQNNFQPALTDFSMVAAVDQVNSTRQKVVYIPPEYRYIDLVGTTNLKNVQIFLYFITARGNIVPFPLNEHGVLTMKIGFIKKTSRLLGSDKK